MGNLHHDVRIYKIRFIQHLLSYGVTCSFLSSHLVSWIVTSILPVISLLLIAVVVFCCCHSLERLQGWISFIWQSRTWSRIKWRQRCGLPDAGYVSTDAIICLIIFRNLKFIDNVLVSYHLKTLLSCHAPSSFAMHTLTCHTCPLQCMPPCHTCLLQCMLPCHTCPLPCMPPSPVDRMTDAYKNITFRNYWTVTRLFCSLTSPNNVWYKQAHWVIETPYLQIIASNVSGWVSLQNF